MSAIEDKNTRYFIDIDLRDRTVSRWGHGHKERLIVRKLESHLHRIYLTPGQYRKFADSITAGSGKTRSAK